jgi:hypothetical protein
MRRDYAAFTRDSVSPCARPCPSPPSSGQSLLRTHTRVMLCNASELEEVGSDLLTRYLAGLFVSADCTRRAVYWPTQKLLAKGLAPRGAPSPHLLPTPHTGEHDKFSTTLPSPQPGVPATATSGPQPPPAHLDRRRMPPGAVLPPEELHYMQAEQQHELERQRRESPQPAAMGWVSRCADSDRAAQASMQQCKRPRVPR